MASPEEVALRDRSLTICQLVYDRQADSDVGIEIRRLLTEGVYIDIQDFNRNNNTPLHIAVLKSDKKCVELLLQYNPSLKIENGTKKTAFDVASCDQIQRLLSTASVNSINTGFVHEIEFQNLSSKTLEALKESSAFKVLKVKNCETVPIVCRKLRSVGVRKAIANSTHLFLFVIETREAEIKSASAILEKVFALKRPMIVQISSTSSENFAIYSKEENSKQFYRILVSAIERDDFMYKVQSEEDCNFNLLVHGLHSNIFGALNGSLLDAKLNADPHRKEISNFIVEHNSLCHRYLKLFDENLTEKEMTNRAESTLQFNGNQSMLALLGLPFKLGGGDIKLTDDQNRILSLKDSRNYNLLMLAIDGRNFAVIDLLICCGIFLNHCGSDGQHASDICWDAMDYESFECLAQLIEAGSPYPEKYDGSSAELIASSASFERIKAVNDATKSFHKSIKSGNIKEVTEFTTNNPKLKQAYDSSNKCALTVALECNRAEIYSFLLSEGFTSGVDNGYASVLRECGIKEDIRNKHREYFKKAFDEPHLKRLLDKYRLSFGSNNRERCSRIIQEMFLKLSEIPAMVPILQIVSTSESLEIIFDFNCVSIEAMDPTANPHTDGRTYHKEGFIYIGAKNHFNAMENLAHELTHYAMKLTYQNGCKPYTSSDETNKDDFQKIVQETHAMCPEDPSVESLVDRIIRNTFLYSQGLWHQELIVRVPELMAKYKIETKKLADIESKNLRLFAYFSTKVLKDVDEQYKILLQRLHIKKINCTTEALKKIKKFEINLEKSEAIEVSDRIIMSNAPQLTLAMLSQLFDESSGVFVTLEQVALGSIPERIRKLSASAKFPVIVDCSGMVEKHSSTICNLKENVWNYCAMILVVTRNEGEMAKSNLPSFELTELEHKWSDLTRESKKYLLEKSVSFQGLSMSLKDLLPESSAALTRVPLNQLIDSDHFVIGKPLPDPFPKNYTPRNFITRTQKKDETSNNPGTSKSFLEAKTEKRADSDSFVHTEKTLSELLLKGSPKVVIISDSAGSGKTSTLNVVAGTLHHKNPTRWTLLVELKQHVVEFKKVDVAKSESFDEFITQKILTDESPLTKEVFAQFYEDGRTNILFDGFDEISPHYKTTVLEALELFSPQSKNENNLENQFWITTRTHLERTLEDSLDQLSCCLMPLTEEKQADLLIKSWKLKTESENENTCQEDLSTIAQKLIKKLSKSISIGSPMLITMLAEIYDEPVTQSKLMQSDFLSVYSIFKKFVEKNVKTWMTKGEIYNLEQQEINLLSESIMEVHQKIAMMHFFGADSEELDVEYDSEEWTVAKLTRMGIMQYDEPTKKLSFTHETFAEFFLTHFIVVNFKKGSKLRGVMEVFAKVLRQKDFQVVRLFLDAALMSPKNLKLDEKLCKSVATHLTRIMNDDENFGMLLTISQETCDELFKFALIVLEEAESGVLEKIIEEKDEFDDSFLNTTIRKNKKETIQSLFEFMGKHTADSAKQLLKKRDSHQSNIFHLASINTNAEIISTILDCASKLLTTEEMKAMLKEENSYLNNLIGLAYARGDESSLNDYVNALAGVLDAEELKELIFNTNQDFLHLSTAWKAQLEMRETSKLIDKMLSKEENKELFQLLDGSVFEQQKKSEESVMELWSNVKMKIFKGELMNADDETSASPAPLAASLESGSHFDSVSFNSRVVDNYFASEAKLLSSSEMNAWLEAKKSDLGSILEPPDENNLDQCRKSEDNFRELLECTTELFTKDEMREKLREMDFDSNQSLNLAASLRSAIRFDTSLPDPEIQKSTQSLLKFIEDLLNVESNSSEGKLLTPNESKTLLETKKSDLCSVLHIAAASRDEDALKDVAKILKEHLNGDDRKNFMMDVNKYGDNFLHYAIRENNKLEVKQLLACVEELLSVQDIKELLQQRGCQESNIFHRALECKNLETFAQLLEFTEKKMRTDETKTMLKEKNSKGCNVLHIVLDSSGENSINELLYVLSQLLSASEMKDLMLDANNNGENFLHLALENKPSSQLYSLFKVLKDSLDLEDTREMLLKRGFREENEVPTGGMGADYFKLLNHLTSLNSVFRSDSSTTLKSILKDMNELSIEDEVREIKQRESQRRNIFHAAIKNKDVEVFGTLLEFAIDRLTANEIKELMMQKDYFGCNVLHLAAKSPCMSYLMLTLLQVLTASDIKELVSTSPDRLSEQFENPNNSTWIQWKELMFDADFEEENFIQSVDHEARRISLKSLFAFNEILTIGDTKNLLRLRGFKQLSVLLRVSGNEDIFSKYFEAVAEILSADEFKAMLEARTPDGRNVVHLATGFDDEKTLNDFVRILKEFLGADEIKELFNLDQIEANLGDNVLHSTVLCKSKSEIESLFKLITKLLNVEDIGRLLKQKGFNQGNIFHRACENKNEKVFPTLLDCIAEMLPKDEIKRMMKEKNSLSCTVIHIASAVCDETTLNGLTEVLKQVLSPEEISELMFEECEENVNFLNTASFCRNQEQMKSIFHFIEGLLSVEDTRKMLRQQGLGQLNIFHQTCGNKNEKIFPTLFEFAAKTLEKDEIKEMMRAKESNSRDVIQLAAIECNENIFADLLNSLKGLFGDDEMKELILVENDASFLHYAIRWKNQAQIKSFFKLTDELMGVENARELLQQRISGRTNIFHLAANNGNVEVFSTVLEFAARKLTEDEISVMLKEEDALERTAFNWLHHGNETLLVTIFKALQEYLTDSEISKIIQHSDHHGSNCLLLAAELNDAKFIDSFFNFIKRYLSTCEQKIFLQTCDADGDNMFTCAAINSHNNIFSVCFNHSQDILTDHEHKHLIQKTRTTHGSNIILHLARNQDESALSELFVNMKNYLNDSELIGLFLHKDEASSNIFHLNAKEIKNLKFIAKLLKFLQTDLNFTSKDLREFLKSVDSENRCAILLAFTNNSIEIRTGLWEILVNIFDFEDWADLLLSIGADVAEIVLEIAENIAYSDEKQNFLRIFFP